MRELWILCLPEKSGGLVLIYLLVANQDPLSMGIFPYGEDLVLKASEIVGSLSI